jgi:hypothetical protein
LLLLAAGLGSVRWLYATNPAAGPPFGAFLLIAAWIYIEEVMSREASGRLELQAIHRWHRTVFAALGVYVACWNGLALAADMDLLSEVWLPTVQRAMGATAGAMLATWGNYLPKLLSPWRVAEEPFDWQGAHRIAGWGASLGGIAIFVAWLSLPLEAAEVTQKGVLTVVFLLAIGVRFFSLASHSPSGGRS